MNAPRIPPVIGRPRRRRWPWILLLAVLLSPFALAGLAGLGIASLFHLSSDTRAVRKAIVQASGTDWDSLVGLRANGLIVGAARVGLSLLELEPEAQAALRAARAGEISVSRLPQGAAAPDCGAMQSAADACLGARGWDRVVGAKQGSNLVAVYVPRKCDSFRRIQCAVVVFTGKELVIASARANLEPLLDCVLEREEFPAQLRELVQR
jgi:hypothetical protein